MTPPEGRPPTLGSSDPEVRRLATAAIAEADASVRLDLLVSALGDEDWRVRKQAVDVARTLRDVRGVVERLVPLLDPARLLRALREGRDREG